jgi:hypothetical protein
MQRPANQTRLYRSFSQSLLPSLSRCTVGGFTRETWSSATLDRTIILGWKHPCIPHASSAHQTDGIRGPPCCFSTLKLLHKFSCLTRCNLVHVYSPLYHLAVHFLRDVPSVSYLARPSLSPLHACAAVLSFFGSHLLHVLLLLWSRANTRRTYIFFRIF